MTGRILAGSRGRDSPNRETKDNIVNCSNEYKNTLSLESFGFKKKNLTPWGEKTNG
jgi:hypothetical protein